VAAAGTRRARATRRAVAAARARVINPSTRIEA
jgi:hypothetical protein